MVSVVIAAYNAAKWIGETLQSVLAQEFTDFEVIVIDDGSTDDTASVVATYGERVQYIQKPNGGQGSARNMGLRCARGEYIAFVDADDLWTKEKLRLQLDLLNKTGLAWAYSDAFAFDDKSGKILYKFSKLYRQFAGDILVPLFLNVFLPSPTLVIRRSIFEHVGYYDEAQSMRNREDWDIWLRIAASYPVCLVSQPLAYYRVHSASMTGGEDPLIKLKGHLIVIDKAVAREPLRLVPFKKQAVANRYVGAGRILARNGKRTEAQRMFARAIRLAPGTTEAYVYWLGCLIGQPRLNLAIRLRQWLRHKGSMKRMGF